MSQPPKPRDNAKRYQATSLMPPSQAPASPFAAPAPMADGAHLRLPMEIKGYVVEQMIAQGGMSLTMLAHVKEFPPQKVVIKAPLSDDPKICHFFEDEIKALEKLSHSGI